MAVPAPPRHGNVGGEVAAALAAAWEEVRGLTRDAGHVSLPVGGEVVVGDLDQPATLSNARQGISAAFLLSGYQDAHR